MEWWWHRLDHMQIICTSLQTDNHKSTSPLKFLQAGCLSCCPTNGVKALTDIECKNCCVITNVQMHDFSSSFGFG